jgi:hypothetical protein
MKTSEILRQARRLIETPDAWVKGMCFGRKTDQFNGPQDAEIIPVPYVRDGKVKPGCFCAIGAICYAGRFFDGDDIAMNNLAAQALAVAIGKPAQDVGLILSFNDRPERSHEQVLAAFDSAIEHAESEDERNAILRENTQ